MEICDCCGLPYTEAICEHCGYDQDISEIAIEHGDDPTMYGYDGDGH